MRKTFSFREHGLGSRTVLHLEDGPLAVLNINILFPGDDLSSRDLLISKPVPQHLQIDMKTLSEQNRSILDGTDCCSVQTLEIAQTVDLIGQILHVSA